MKKAVESSAVDQTFWDKTKEQQASRQSSRRRTSIGQARQAIVRRIAFDARVLDIGCGEGTLLQTLRDERNCQVRGIDIAPGKIAICHERGLDAILGDADRFDTEEKIGSIISSEYDVVIFSKSIQYIHRREEILSQLRTERIYVYRGNPDRWQLPGAGTAALTRSPIPDTTQGTIEWIESFGFRGSILFFDRGIALRLNLNSLPLPRFLLRRFAANVVLEFVRDEAARKTEA